MHAALVPIAINQYSLINRGPNWCMQNIQGLWSNIKFVKNRQRFI